MANRLGGKMAKRRYITTTPEEDEQTKARASADVGQTVQANRSKSIQFAQDKQTARTLANESAKLDIEKKKKDLAGKDQDLITSTYQSVINDKEYHAVGEKDDPVKHDLNSLNAGTVDKEGRTVTVDDVVQKRAALAKVLMKNKIFITDKIQNWKDDEVQKEKVGKLSELPQNKQDRWVSFVKELVEDNADKKKDADAALVRNIVEQPEYTRHAVKLIEAFFKDRGKNPDKYKKNYKDGK